MKRQRGFSFLEVLVALVIASILGTISVWAFGSSAPDCSNPTVKQNPLMRAKIAEISGDLGQIHMALSRYELSHGRYPATLAEAGVGNLTDSWGNPYQYLVILGRQDLGPVRKDHNLKPVNSGYDIYSMGPDGETASPFTSTLGQDDIVMANDGDYFGLACQYGGSGKN